MPLKFVVSEAELRISKFENRVFLCKKNPVSKLIADYRNFSSDSALQRLEAIVSVR